MEPEVSFGAWLQRRRKALDLTQDALAQRVACSVATIRKIEADERRPSRQVADLLAEMLEIPAGDRAHFLRIARGELRVERLAAVPPVPPTPVPETVKVIATTSPSALLPPRSSLPMPPTPLIGRATELAELHRLLARPECRLLTVVGPGGIGKTRLALAAAAEQMTRFADGVYFVPLAPLSSPEHIVSAIANALEFTFAGSGEPKRQLLNYLAGKVMLIVLDNLEHLLDDIGLLTELLEYASEVKLLVTSRERLNLQGEWVFDLQGLPTPPDGLSEQLEEYSAVTLFIECARRVRTGFALAERNRQAVARICQLVEGMPLGIELAAAWVHLLACQEIAEEIERNLDFLAVANDVICQNATAVWRAAFEHSWKLLSAEERRVLRQLAVFRGGFTRAAISEVAGGTLPVLASLITKSLLRRVAEDRYDLHEFIRQYAGDILAADAREQQATQARHTAYYATRMENWCLPLMSRLHHETASAIKAEIDNIRLAWQQAVEKLQLGEIRRMLECLGWFYETQCLFAEAEDVFRHAAEQLRNASVEPRAESNRGQYEDLLAYLLTSQGWFSFRIGKIAEALPLLQESLTRLRTGRDPQALFHTLVHNVIWVHL